MSNTEYASPVVVGLSDEMFEASCSGNLQVLAPLVKSCEDEIRSPRQREQHQYNLQNILKYACAGGHLAVARHVLTCQEIKIHAKMEDVAFLYACAGGHVNMVDYFLRSPELDACQVKRPDIESENFKPLLYACENGHGEVVRYLVNHYMEKSTNEEKCQEMKEIGFSQAYYHDHMEIVKFFIMQAHIECSATIEKLVDEGISHWFELRNLKGELNENLPANAVQKKPNL